MYQITVKIEGMACSMCEAHVNDVLRKNFSLKKVHSSHSKNQTEIIALEPITAEQLKAVLDPTGYQVVEAICQPQPYQKRFSLFGK